MKHKPALQSTRIRTSAPMTVQGKNGYELRCPFCSDHHLIGPGIEALCGTQIEVTVSQEVYPVRTVRAKNLTCAKCFLGDGEMVRYGTSYIHLVDCKPEIRLLQDIPSNNRLAQLVFNLPKWFQPHIEKFTGHADRVREIDETGKETGKIIAYIFWSPSGKHQPTNA